MPPPRKMTDAEVISTFQQYGTIREASRNSPLSYNSFYKQLERLGQIRTTFDMAAEGKANDITLDPVKVTLILPDLQAPAHHPDALPFLLKLRDKYKPGRIIAIGDEVDFNHMSDFAKMAESDNPTGELNDAINFMRMISAEFPDVHSCVSNHVHGRVEKARQRARVAPALFKDIADILDTPPGWSWHTEIRYGDILIRHGHKDVQNLKRVILEEMPAKYGRHYSILLGHFHQKMGQHTPDIKVNDRFYWGGFTGCLINPRHRFFSYSRGYERLGTVLLVDGRIRPCAMPVDATGRWTGELI